MKDKQDALVQANASQRRELIASYTAEVRLPPPSPRVAVPASPIPLSLPSTCFFEQKWAAQAAAAEQTTLVLASFHRWPVA
jgi:hypothetical protein